MNLLKKAVSFIFLSYFSLAAQAATISPTDTGWYSSYGTHETFNTNYIAGYNSESGAEFRNFLVFDLSSVNAVSSAVLRMFLLDETRESFGYFSNDAFETWVLREVTTNINELTNFAAPDPFAVFNELGAGTLFGSVDIAQNDEGSFVEVVLNADALTSLSSANGLWAIGGAISTLNYGSSKEYVFSGSFNAPGNVELVINQTSDIPAPTGLAFLILAGALCLIKRK